MKETFIIEVRCVPLKQSVHKRRFHGTQAEAERLMGDIWNEHGASMPDRGYRCTLKRAVQGMPLVMTID